MHTYRVRYSLRTIEPFIDVINLEFFEETPSVEKIKEELLIQKPNLEKKKDLINIDSAIKFTDETQRKTNYF